MMYCHVSLEALLPIKLLKTSLMGIATEPKEILTTKRNSTVRNKDIKRKVFCLLFINIFLLEDLDILFQFFKEIQFIIWQQFRMDDFHNVF